ncbi:50S ribosomal protein L1 [Candidatus Saccharibacteria bacterium]|jgi:large subunit ribosomal protein L1|nr:50S ribosomal protein L1 [Candidatus Saccharibacteria bacterium]
MAKKAELLEEAKKLKLKVTEKNTIAEITEAIKNVEQADESPEASTNPESTDDSEDKKFTKAGKHSKKAVEEAEAEEAKEERKAKIAAGELDPSTNEEGEVVASKGPVPIPRARVERRSKRFQTAVADIDRTKTYEVNQAVQMAQKASTVKFDASIELHMNLNVNPKHADQNIRGSMVLPNGNGKTQRVAVFAAEDLHKDAKAAGADIVYADDLLDKLKAEEIDFDVLVSTPENMAKLGRFAKLLGPKGLMPNPKSGTVTKDVAKAVSEAKAGRVEYRVDKAGIMHLAVGKVSFKDEQLTQNIDAVIKVIKEARPASVKSDYVKSISINSTMGPGVKINLAA